MLDGTHSIKYIVTDLQDINKINFTIMKLSFVYKKFLHSIESYFLFSNFTIYV